MLPDDAPKTIVRDYFETIVTCVIFVIFARTFVFQQSKIPTGSMIPTLLVGDYIMVNKFAFSPMSSVPALAGVEHFLLPVRDLTRRDIVVFKYPEEPEKDYIKRVIGLPGETVYIHDGLVYINDKLLDEPYLEGAQTACRPETDACSSGPVTVPAGAVFVMGDNRGNSSDSREGDALPLDRIIGKAWLSYWPRDDWGVIPSPIYAAQP